MKPILLPLGMLIYRVFPNVPKMPLKIAHGTFMVLAIALSAAGLKSAFDSHTLRNIPHMYSLHSWIGIVTISLFGLQVRPFLCPPPNRKNAAGQLNMA